MTNFSELGLSEELLRAVEEQGYEHPMPVQEQVIPHLLTDCGDLIGLAQTGTGKTAAYGLPLLQRWQTGQHAVEGEGKPQSVILSPTRELCIQIADDLHGFAKYVDGVRILAVYGGANIEPQIRALRHGIDIIVATPGRLLDLMKRKAADLSEVGTLVLDEADEMLSMGFHDDLEAILSGLTSPHRTLLFSATMGKEVERIALQYLNEPTTIQVGSRNEGAESVNHIYYMVGARDKYLALKRIVDYHPRIYAIIFCHTKMETQQVADNLIRDGYNADALHGDLSQQQRDLTMQKFRRHRTQLLVATDVAARGLDVDDLTHVINFGMPDDMESYTHRSGRTGRAGKKGTSICIINTRERRKIKQVEHVIKKDFVKGQLPNPKEICTKQLYHVIDDIERVEVDEEEIAPFLGEVNSRWEWLDKEDLVKRILSREFGRFLQYYANAPEIEDASETNANGNSGKKKGKRKGDKGGNHSPEPGYARLFLTVGKMDGYYAKEIIKMVNDHVRGGKVNIGRIDLLKNFSFIEVSEDDASRVINGIRGIRVKGRAVDISMADTESKSGGNKKKRTQHDDEPKGKKFDKADWMKFMHPEKSVPKKRKK